MPSTHARSSSRHSNERRRLIRRHWLPLGRFLRSLAPEGGTSIPSSPDFLSFADATRLPEDLSWRGGLFRLARDYGIARGLLGPAPSAGQGELSARFDREFDRFLLEAAARLARRRLRAARQDRLSTALRLRFVELAGVDEIERRLALTPSGARRHLGWAEQVLRDCLRIVLSAGPGPREEVDRELVRLLDQLDRRVSR